MSTTTTLTSMAASRSEPKELCIVCESQPFDLICTCGDKFDFNCIHQHVEQIGLEFQEHFQDVSEKLVKISGLQEKQNKNFDTAQKLIDDWKRKRIQEINDIAEQAQQEARQRENTFEDYSVFQQTYDKLSTELHRVGHENLNIIMELHRQIREKMDDFEKSVEFKHDDGRLDALIQAKLNPSVLPTNLHSQELTTNEIEPILSNSSTLRSTQPTTELSNTNTLRSTQPTTELSNTNTLRSTQPTSELLNTDTLRSTQPTSGSSNTNTLRLTQPPTASPTVDALRAALSRIQLPSTESLRSTQPRIETTDTETVRSTQPRTETTNTETLRSNQPTIETTYTETPKSTQPAAELTNTASPNDNVTESTTNDEFDAGHTQHIQRANPILISTINDKFAGTVCCHNNQLLYNDFDRTTQSSHLIFIRDITNPTTKQSITWDEPDSPLNASDDEWIQDIIYSDKISGYLILNRARLRVLKPNCHDLDEFQQFPDRTMKRLTCNDKHIYLTSTRSGAGNTGDEIILMNYDKEEQLCKTFRDIIPSRINRGAGPLVGEISDIAAGSNNQVTIGYRLERRHEVGVCVFNVLNDGKEWSCIKQLLLNECWHSDLSYTPRIDWCEKLNLFLLIEYMTGHLIMIDKDGQVEGECRFMHVENRRESPINLAISTNDWVCVRYESSISIHRVNS